jgi:hypothetical protein
MGPWPGVQTGPEGHAPRFVLLEHTWNGIHWDLMLEAGPVLRNWAIDEPLVVGRDLAARALADHRPIYLDYEGPIAGDRGTVRRVDRGTFEVRVWEPDRVIVDLQGDQLSGVADLWRDRSDTSRVCWYLRLGNFI